MRISTKSLQKDGDVQVPKRGFIMLDRGIQFSAFYDDPKKLKAFIDICFTVRYSEDVQKKFINGRLRSWGKGQMPISLSFLSERWNMSKDSVRNFLRFLEAEKYITTEIVSGQTILTLIPSESSIQSEQKKDLQEAQLNAGPNEVSSLFPNSEEASESITQANNGINRRQSQTVRKKKTVEIMEKNEIIYAFGDEDFKNAVDEFYEHRLEIDKPLTLRALKIINRKLLGVPVSQAIEMLENSIVGSYQGVYPVKSKLNESKPNLSETKFSGIATFVGNYQETA